MIPTNRLNQRRVRVVLLAVLIMLSLPVMHIGGAFSASQSGIATAQEDSNASHYDDFEDGELSGWSPSEDVDISSESYSGSQSLVLNDSNDESRHAFLEGGPRLHSHDNFEISGTYKATGDDNGVWHGLADGDYDSHPNDRNYVYIQTATDGSGKITLESEDDATNILGETTLRDDYQEGDWLNFRLQFDSGEVQAQVWEAGTDQPSEWQGSVEAPEFESYFWLHTGQTDHNRQLHLDEYDLGGAQITGQVVDQNGNPVPNATVESIGADYDRLNETYDDAQARADELYDMAQNPAPEDWRDRINLMEQGTLDGVDSFSEGVKELESNLPSEFDEASSNYVAVHTTQEWDLRGRDIPAAPYEVGIDPDLSSPNAVAPVDEKVVLSVWDPSEESFIENDVDSELPGATSTGNVVVEQISPGGDVLDETVHETQPYVSVTQIGSITGKDHHAVVVDLPDGHIYRVYPEGSPETAYLITTGEPGDIISNVIHDLEDRAGQYEDRAQEISDLIDGGEFARTTATTDSNGQFSLHVPRGVKSSIVQAYRADGKILTQKSGPSLSDLREISENDYNGSVHLSAPQETKVPASGVTIETYRTPSPPFQDLDDFSSIQDWLDEQRLNETLEDVVSEYDQHFSEMERATLVDIYENHRTLVETLPGAEDEYLSLSDYDSIQDSGDLGTDELRTEIGHMQDALTVGDGIQLPDGTSEVIEVTDGELYAELPIPPGVDTDTISPEIHWSDGTVESIDGQYWDIESADGFFSDEQVTIDGYPINETDPAAFDLRIMGAGGDGMFDGRFSGLNPSFDGEVPDIRAIDVNTLSPGPSESISMEFREAEGAEIGDLRYVEAFGPDGNSISTQVNGLGANFQTQGEGEYHVRAAVSDSTGAEFVLSFQFRALEQSRSDPPTLRAERAVGDLHYALAGENLRDGEIASDGGELRISAVSRTDGNIGSVHVKPQQAIQEQPSDISVQVLEGSDWRAIDSSIETVIHLDSLSEDSAIWRGQPGWVFTDPLSVGDTSRHGEVLMRQDDKGVIRTFTEDDGSISIHLDEDPGRIKNIQHRVNTIVPTPSIPYLSISLPDLAPTLGVADVGEVIS